MLRREQRIITVISTWRRRNSACAGTTGFAHRRMMSLLCPLYGALSLKRSAQSDPPGTGKGMRKVVLATNIAETSLTIEGIRLVVDCAQERVARFDPRTGLARLITQRVSRASMTQRAGRAGRLGPGISLHLIAKEQAERAAATK
ncbi:hypothetical protein MJK71_05360 [Escherichia coli]|nr:hypothetical protein MJK71_05360 [Escherichia coli]